MKSIAILTSACLLAAPAPLGAKPTQPEPNLTPHGSQLAGRYESLLGSLRADIAKDLPALDPRKKTALDAAREALGKATADAKTAGEALAKIATAKALVDHAKGKWIGGAEKGIAEAEAALRKATTAAERESAEKDLAKWQANKADGIKALAERQQAYDLAKRDEGRLTESNKAAQAALASARAAEMAAAKAILEDMRPVLTDGKRDAALVKCAVLATATPKGLAEFAQQGEPQEALVEGLLGDVNMMKQMLEAGGAARGRYGQAVAIYAAIRKASPGSKEGVLQRLAMATSLEHAQPIEQINAKDLTGAPATVDPVKRYLHYEKAFLDGELDPAFKDFTVWEYRMVVGCDAPDEILAWGRQMLRTYRPDHVRTDDYGWRYSAAVRTDVTYGSQNVKNDLPSLHSYQNIPKNGGVCGRRAFFGRFILRGFGIPVWGVTQHAHAALSHWTPKGWVVNLGAGFEHSWWDKGDAPRGGSDFLLETQAREHGSDYLTVLRAQWVSAALGEQPYNDRKNVPGGFWSNLAHYQTVTLASAAVPLGPLGKELAEANEPANAMPEDRTKATRSDQKITVAADGTITIPAVAFGKAKGKPAIMDSFGGGMQMHCVGGFGTDYELNVPKAGKYILTAKVATLQDGQTFVFTPDNSGAPSEIPVPYTVGLWQHTPPLEIQLASGRNTLGFAIREGSRGVTVKEFTLKPMK
ncbi:MAG: hypothetical protein J0M04_02060 [Verrucomicrobia bacterium]|nr:hypothetical protein [Verrucomicrobiota bacterium]